jgi:hypothetical protein
MACLLAKNEKYSMGERKALSPILPIARLNAMFVSGAGELLIADGVFIFGEPVIEYYLSNDKKRGCE